MNTNDDRLCAGKALKQKKVMRIHGDRPIAQLDRMVEQFDDLVGIIQAKTGLAPGDIEALLEDLATRSPQKVGSFFGPG